MDAIRITTTVEHDGEIHLLDLPLKKGQRIEMIVLPQNDTSNQAALTAKQLVDLDIVGLWADRHDLGDSAAYARTLREQSQQRSHE